MTSTSESPDSITTEGSSSARDLQPVSLWPAGIALLVFVAAIYVVYGFYLEAPRWDKNFGVADNRHFFGPNTFYLDCALKNGEFPLWNPLSYCGLPFSADGQASACYPFHLLRSYLTPGFDPYASAVGMQILMVLHVLWAGLGAFFLAQSYGLSLFASIVCGLAFMFSPFSIVYFTDYYVYSLTLSWAGWILWALRRTLRSRTWAQRLRNGAWTVFFFSLSSLGGFPQLSLYIGIMVTLYIALDGLLHVSWRGGWKVVCRVFRLVCGRAMLLAVIAVLTALASAVLLLPELEMGLLGARTIVGGLAMPAWPQDLGAFHLLKCLVIYPGNTWLPQGCRAAGIGALLAVIAALGHSRRRDVLVFLGLYVLMTDCTLGPPFPLGWLLRQVDFMNITASPWRAGDFSLLALGMVAAFGVDAAGRMPGRLRWRVLRTTVLVAAGAGMFWVASQWLEHLPPLLFQPSALVWILPAVTLLVLCAGSWLHMPRLGSLLVAILIGCEIVAWSADMLPNAINRHGIRNNPDTARFGQARQLTLANKRLAHARPNRQMWLLDHAVNGYNPLYLGATSQVLCSPADDRGYFNRVHLKHRAVTKENLRGTLLAKRCFWLAREWVPGPLPPKNEPFPVATTVFLPEISPGADLTVPEVERKGVEPSGVSKTNTRKDLGNEAELKKRIQSSGENLRIQFRDVALEFRHAVLCIEYRATGKVPLSAACVDETYAYHTLKTVQTEPGGNQQRTLQVPLPDCGVGDITLSWPAKQQKEFQITGAYVLSDLADEDAYIVIENRTPNTVTVLLKDLPAARVLTFIDSYYPGWHAWLDGREIDILRADDAFKAVVVPEGTHRVHFRYTSKTTSTGLAISLVTYALLAGVLLIVLYRNAVKHRGQA